MHTKINARFLPLLAVMTLLGGGCAPFAKQVTPPTPKPTMVPALMELRYDACQMLTKEDAKAVLGKDVNDPLRNAAQNGAGDTTVSSCSYATAGTSEAETLGLSLLIRKSPTTADAAKTFAEARKNSKGLSGMDPVDVNGLGDAAYWSGGTLTQMNVLLGDAWYIVNVKTPSGGEQRLSLDAARRAIGKLK